MVPVCVCVWMVRCVYEGGWGWGCEMCVCGGEVRGVYVCRLR